jgi:hypothetical protein
MSQRCHERTFTIRASWLSKIYPLLEQCSLDFGPRKPSTDLRSNAFVSSACCPPPNSQCFAMNKAFIEIRVRSPEKLALLELFVERLSEAKRSGIFPEDAEWNAYFDSSSLAYFEKLSPVEWKEWEADWKAASIERRHRDSSLSPHWDFESFLDALKNGEWLISSLQVTVSSLALIFEPMAYPYGGAECLIASVEAFGQEVTGVDDGTGYRSYVKLPRWQPRSRGGPDDA